MSLFLGLLASVPCVSMRISGNGLGGGRAGSMLRLRHAAKGMPPVRGEVAGLSTGAGASQGGLIAEVALQVERNNVQSALRCIDCYEQGFVFLDLADPTGWQILYISPQAAAQTGMGPPSMWFEHRWSCTFSRGTFGSISVTSA